MFSAVFRRFPDLVLPLWLMTSLAASPETSLKDFDGKRLFTSYCSACHQPDGSGTEDGAPPLNHSPWIEGPRQHSIRELVREEDFDLIDNSLKTTLEGLSKNRIVTVDVSSVNESKHYTMKIESYDDEGNRSGGSSTSRGSSNRIIKRYEHVFGKDL